MQIKGFPEKSNRNNLDLLLIQDGTDNQFKHITVSNFLKNLATGSQTGSANNWQIINGNFEASIGDNIFIYSPNDVTVTLPSSAVVAGEIELKRKDTINKISLVGLTKINDVSSVGVEEILLSYSKHSTKLIYIDSTIGWISIPTEDIIIKRPLALPTANLIQKFYTVDINASDGTKVASWADTVSFLDATQNDSNQQPIYKGNIFNSLPGILFNGNSYFSTDLTYLANKPYTIAIVEARNTTSQTYLFGQDNGGTNQALHIGYRGNNEFTLAQYGNDLNVQIESYASLKPTIWVVSNNSRGKEIWRNGIKIGATSNTDNLSTGSNGRLGRATNNNFNGYLGLIATWIGDKSISEIQDIFTAINNTFAIY